jgi:hypothetical protein
MHQTQSLKKPAIAPPEFAEDLANLKASLKFEPNTIGNAEREVDDDMDGGTLVQASTTVTESPLCKR